MKPQRLLVFCLSVLALAAATAASYFFTTPGDTFRALALP